MPPCAVKPLPLRPHKLQPQMLLRCLNRIRSFPRQARQLRIIRILMKAPSILLKRRKHQLPLLPLLPSRNLSGRSWLCVVMTDLARRKSSKRQRAEVASLATGEKALVMAALLIRALDQAIVLAIAETVVIASNVLIEAPVWVMQPSALSAMRWSMQR
jgi:hypothetical protein